MRILTHIADGQDDGRAVRSVVPRRFSLGAHAFRRLKVLGGIRINGEPVRASAIVHAGDVITLHLESDVQEASCARVTDASLPPSHIRYIDEDLIIAAKGAPLPTLPSRHIRTETLREQLCAMLGAQEDSFTYHPVNRLDKGTSGLLVIARHAHAQRLLSLQLHSGDFIREYLAVSQGIPEKTEGVIDAPIARPGSGARRIVREDGQRAVTHYRVERTRGDRALLRLRLETGRTHQIRVHLAHIGCPIAGDYLYGSEIGALAGRFALHSAYLLCRHPITGQIISLSEPLPDELERLL